MSFHAFDRTKFTNRPDGNHRIAAWIECSGDDYWVEKLSPTNYVATPRLVAERVKRANDLGAWCTVNIEQPWPLHVGKFDKLRVADSCTKFAALRREIASIRPAMQVGYYLADPLCDWSDDITLAAANVFSDWWSRGMADMIPAAERTRRDWWASAKVEGEKKRLDRVARTAEIAPAFREYNYIGVRCYLDRATNPEFVGEFIRLLAASARQAFRYKTRDAMTMLAFIDATHIADQVPVEPKSWARLLMAVRAHFDGVVWYGGGKWDATRAAQVAAAKEILLAA